VIGRRVTVHKRRASTFVPWHLSTCVDVGSRASYLHLASVRKSSRYSGAANVSSEIVVHQSATTEKEVFSNPNISRSHPVRCPSRMNSAFTSRMSRSLPYLSQSLKTSFMLPRVSVATNDKQNRLRPRPRAFRRQGIDCFVRKNPPTTHHRSRSGGHGNYRV
jgi:hypothetical protein